MSVNLLTSQKIKNFISMINYSINISILIGVAVLFTVVVFQIFIYSKQAPTKIQISYNDNLVMVDLLQEDSPSYDYYQSQFESGKFLEIPEFFLRKDVPTAHEEGYNHQSTPSLQLLVRNLVLVGIILDQSPIAVIEDTETKESFFLSIGDHIADVFVKEIQPKKVILQYKEQTIEISQ